MKVEMYMSEMSDVHIVPSVIHQMFHPVTMIFMFVFVNN